MSVLGSIKAATASYRMNAPSLNRYSGRFGIAITITLTGEQPSFRPLWHRMRRAKKLKGKSAPWGQERTYYIQRSERTRRAADRPSREGPVWCWRPGSR